MVGRDDGIADARQSGVQPFALLVEGGLALLQKGRRGVQGRRHVLHLLHRPHGSAGHGEPLRQGLRRRHQRLDGHGQLPAQPQRPPHRHGTEGQGTADEDPQEPPSGGIHDCRRGEQCHGPPRRLDAAEGRIDERTLLRAVRKPAFLGRSTALSHARGRRSADEALGRVAPGQNAVLAIVEARDPARRQLLLAKQPSEGGGRARQAEHGLDLAAAAHWDIQGDDHLVGDGINDQVRLTGAARRHDGSRPGKRGRHGEQGVIGHARIEEQLPVAVAERQPGLRWQHVQGFQALLIEVGQIPSGERARHGEHPKRRAHLADFVVQREGQGPGGLPHAPLGGAPRLMGDQEDHGDGKAPQGQQGG